MVFCCKFILLISELKNFVEFLFICWTVQTFLFKTFNNLTQTLFDIKYSNRIVWLKDNSLVRTMGLMFSVIMVIFLFVMLSARRSFKTPCGVLESYPDNHIPQNMHKNSVFLLLASFSVLQASRAHLRRNKRYILANFD